MKMYGSYWKMGDIPASYVSLPEANYVAIHFDSFSSGEPLAAIGLEFFRKNTGPPRFPPWKTGLLMAHVSIRKRKEATKAGPWTILWPIRWGVCGDFFLGVQNKIPGWNYTNEHCLFSSNHLDLWYFFLVSLQLRDEFMVSHSFNGGEVTSWQTFAVCFFLGLGPEGRTAIHQPIGWWTPGAVCPGNVSRNWGEVW